MGAVDEGADLNNSRWTPGRGRGRGFAQLTEDARATGARARESRTRGTDSRN